MGTATTGPHTGPSCLQPSGSDAWRTRQQHGAGLPPTPRTCHRATVVSVTAFLQPHRGDVFGEWLGSLRGSQSPLALWAP